MADVPKYFFNIRVLISGSRIPQHLQAATGWVASSCCKAKASRACLTRDLKSHQFYSAAGCEPGGLLPLDPALMHTAKLVMLLNLLCIRLVLRTANGAISINVLFAPRKCFVLPRVLKTPA